MRMTSNTLSVFAGLMLMSLSAQATEFTTLDAGQSSIGFAFKQMNVPAEGKFKQLTGSIDFDPDKPAQAKAEINIALASVDAGSDEANGALADTLWFDTKTYPTARFVTTSLAPVGNHQFNVTGAMTIKGQTHRIESIATFHQEDRIGVLEGKFTLQRADFAIGTGMWADFGTVANEVQIKFRLVVHAATRQK